ncbi:GH1 family beta-glucosidase [Kitasatospora sp. NPDC048722]|uniref:GH1 family beta-glucosidase n=1 Tax=Kitasatospora sp. NPDC048722 TaxID=3155639 RepID=UPI0033F947AA
MSEQTFLRFPDGFRWGAATSAYQIEGAASEDGRTPSIWDVFSHSPGATVDGTTGDTACDHYHRHGQDVALMADLGLQAYRFSLSWSRLQPDGSGQLNPKALDSYRRLLDSLHENGIKPVATLYHWDLPQTLEDRGGWRARDTAWRFADYARQVGERLGDLVDTFITVNEPWCAAFLGYASGLHAPGVQDPPGALRAAHHLLLGHGLATRALRVQGRHRAIGPAPNFYPVQAVSDDPTDQDAARRIDLLMNRLVLEPVATGAYPADILAHIEPIAGLGHLREGDEAVIGTPIDFLGVNYYSSHTVGAGTVDHRPSPWVGAEDVVFHPTGLRTTAMGWDVDPDGLRRQLERIAAACPDLPIWITENGAAYADTPDDNGRVHDPDRIEFLRDHLAALHDAIQAGVNVRGYLLWSLMDNFEWSEGHTKRFGLVHVDFATQRRTPKSSAHWYGEVIRSNGLKR